MSSRRITRGVERASPITIRVDDEPVEAYPGETLAAVLMASGRFIVGYNWDRRARGPVCNMGVCYECLVETRPGRVGDGDYQLQRACMTPVADGMVVRTTRHRA